MRKFLIYFVGIPAALYGLWRLSYPSYTLWQNTTLTIEAPDGVHSGTGSVKIFLGSRPALFEIPPTWSEISGEATIVDLGGGKYVFALVGLGGKMSAAELAKNPLVRARETYKRRDEAAIELPRENYPLLVTFAEIGDPASVEFVDPDDMDSSLGCNRATIEPKPWVKARMSWLDWSRWQASGLSLQEYARFSKNRLSVTLANEVKKKIDLFAPKERDTSADCYRLVSFTQSSSSTRASESSVEQVLPWLREVGQKQWNIKGGRTVSSADQLIDSVLHQISPTHFATDLFK